MKIKKGKLYYNTETKKLVKYYCDSIGPVGNLTDKIAVHCPTKEDWDYVCNKLNFNDLLIYRHSEYNDKSCINVNIGFCSKKWYKRNGYHIITIDQFKEFYPPQINIMKIEKGNKFLCIRDVVMSEGDIAYRKGEIYQSDCDGCITNINREDCHRWTSEDAPHFYFKLLSEFDRVYTDATDRLRELYNNYTGCKFGNPINAKYFGTKLSDGEPLFILARDGYINTFLTYGYVTEDTFIELMGMNVDQEEDYDDPYNWVVNGMKDVPVKKTDRIVKSVIDKYQQRSEVGIKKYGTTLEDNEDGIEIFLTHLQDEMMDATLYIEKLKNKFAKLKKDL